MSNKKKQRSSRQVKVPVKFNDHVMNNVNQRRNENKETVGEKLGNDKGKGEGVIGNENNSNENGDTNTISANEKVIVCNVMESEKGENAGNLVENNGDCSVSHPITVNAAHIDNNVDSVNNDRDIIDDNGVKETDSLIRNSYVKALNKNMPENDNKLFLVPTGVNEKGDEVVVFDEELVREGSEKWKNTVCGYFVGSSMLVSEVKYNLRRMWGKHGLEDIVVDNDELCFVKFKSVEGMNFIIDQSPWMVNGRPFLVQKWDPEVIIVKSAPRKIPIWIKLFNVPLEAWSVKGISAISSRLGRPIMMDQMTSSMCSKGTGRLGYARVMVEIEAAKGFLDTIEINYVDDQCKNKRTKWVKVEYAWKPNVCSHCKVYGHSYNLCKERPRSIAENENTKLNNNAEAAGKDGFINARNRRNIAKMNGGNFSGVQGGNQGMNSRNIIGKYMFRPKSTNVPVVKEKQAEKQAVNDKQRVNETVNGDPPSLEKVWNVGKENVNENKETQFEDEFPVLQHTKNKSAGGNLKKKDLNSFSPLKTLVKNDKQMQNECPDEEDVHDDINGIAKCISENDLGELGKKLWNLDSSKWKDVEGILKNLDLSKC